MRFDQTGSAHRRGRGILTRLRSCYSLSLIVVCYESLCMKNWRQEVPRLGAFIEENPSKLQVRGLNLLWAFFGLPFNLLSNLSEVHSGSFQRSSIFFSASFQLPLNFIWSSSEVRLKFLSGSIERSSNFCIDAEHAGPPQTLRSQVPKQVPRRRRSRIALRKSGFCKHKRQ